MNDIKTTSSDKPNTYKERVLHHILKKLLQHGPFGMEDDLFEMGLDDGKIPLLIEEARHAGLDLSAGEIKEGRTMRNILRRHRKVCSWLGGCFPEKPVLVVVSGVSVYARLEKMIGQLREDFSILFIESIVEHWNLIFREDTIEEVVDFYLAVIRYMLPEGTRLFGFLGQSYGGEISYRLAIKWEAQTGDRPLLYVFDTWLMNYDRSRFDEIRQGILEKIPQPDRTKAEVYWQQHSYWLDISKLLGDGKALPSYDGPVRLFSAMQVKEDAALAAVLPVKAIMTEDNPNVQAWRRLVPQIRVEYIDADHLDLMTADDCLRKLKKWTRRDLSFQTDTAPPCLP